MPPSFSIIIPHYEIPALLERCLASIPEREDVEVIVVDDCSSVDTVAEVSRMVTSRHDARLFSTKRHSGGGAARNVGLKEAKGRFLVFSDADDMFSEIFPSILDDYGESDADMIFFGAEGVGVHTDGYDITPVLAERLAARDETWLRFLFGQPWCKIVSRDMVENRSLTFDETTRCNDTTFSYLAGYHASRVETDTRKGYIHIARASSASDTTDGDVMLACLDVFARKNAFLREHATGLYDNTFNVLCASIRRHKRISLTARAIIHAARYGWGWVTFRYFVLKKPFPVAGDTLPAGLTV